MKRDLGIFRAILLQMEAVPAGKWIKKFDPLPTVDWDTLDEHLRLMVEAGLITGCIHEGEFSRFTIPQDITNRGHEFLDNVRDNVLWKKTKKRLDPPAWRF